MPDTCCGNANACNCCHGIWRPTLGRTRMLPWDTGRSWIVKNTGVFALIRFVLFFFGALFLIFSAITDQPPPGGNIFAAAWSSYWKFYTHWTLALLTCYYFIASLFSYTLWKKEQAGDIPRDHSNDTEHQESNESAQPSDTQDSSRDLRRESEDANEVSQLAAESHSAGEIQRPPRQRSGVIAFAPNDSRPSTDTNGNDGHTLDDNINVELNLEGVELHHSREHRRRHHHILHRRVPFGEFCFWLLYETTWASAIFLACTFWVFIGLGCVPRKSCTKINPHFWIAQLLNILFVLADLFLNKIPFIPSHSVVTFGYCVLWLIFSVILFVVTGHWVYPQDGTHGQLWTAITFWPGWILLNVLSFYFGMLLDWIVTKFAPQKHSIRGTDLTFHTHRNSRRFSSSSASRSHELSNI